MGNSVMVKPCPELRVLSVLVVLSMTMTVPCAFDVDAAGEAPGIEGIQPPVDGDWDITSDTNVRGVDITIHGNITIASRVTLQVFGSNLTVTGGNGWTSTIDIRIASSLSMDRSTIHVDNIEAREQAAVRLNLTEVHAMGRIRMSPGLLSVQGSTIRLEPPRASTGTDGTGASLNLSAQVSGELKESTVVCAGGDAGLTLPGQNGSAGGPADAVIALPDISGCDVTVTAGEAASGGLGFAGTDGGSGGRGGNASLSIVADRIEDCALAVVASNGSNGARGADNATGDAGDGGNGGAGGNASMDVLCVASLGIATCAITVDAGDGGSGWSGGNAVDGDGGNGGWGAPAGNATLEVHAAGNMTVENLTVTCTGGDGGFGGDFGRRTGTTGDLGAPRPGGDGGAAAVNLTGGGNLVVRKAAVTARAGAGYDGGTGYDQGETGGNGADAVLIISVEAGIEADRLDLSASGGNGGNGGPAYSNIYGNGGDGGDSHIGFMGPGEMRVNRSGIHTHPGRGGKGNTPFWNGDEGIASLDLATQSLDMWDCALDQPLDDLAGSAQGLLHNCSIETPGPPALPLENAIVYMLFPVDILVVDRFDVPSREPLVNFTVTIRDAATDIVVSVTKTDGNGCTSAYLGSYRYTSKGAEYIGAYIVSVTSPDGKAIKEVRLDVRGPIFQPTPFTVVMTYDKDIVWVYVDTPLNESFLRFSPLESALEVTGHVGGSNEYAVTGVKVTLRPHGGSASYVIAETLTLSPIPLSGIPNESYKWGKYFEPETGGVGWPFFSRLDILGASFFLANGEHWLTVEAYSGPVSGSRTLALDIVLSTNLPPTLAVTTRLDGIDWNSTALVVIDGVASDDRGFLEVETCIDGGPWTALNGTVKWSFSLDLAQLRNGFHTIRFRATDGFYFSDVASWSFTIDRQVEPGGGEDDAGTGLATVAVVLILVAFSAILVVVLLRRRSSAQGGG